MAEFLTKEQKRTYDKHINTRLRGVLRGTYGRTVALTNAMSAADINAQIDALHKYIPYGESITFQNADGNYNLTAPIVISGFYGGGDIYFQGNPADNTQAVAKNVFYDFISETDGICVVGCKLNMIEVRYMKIRHENDKAVENYGVTFDACAYTRSIANYITGKSTTRGANIRVLNGGECRVNLNYVDLAKYGIWSNEMAKVYSHTNDDNPAGTMPLWGLYASRALIFKNGNQPNGSTANELTSEGGQIW